MARLSDFSAIGLGYAPSVDYSDASVSQALSDEYVAGRISSSVWMQLQSNAMALGLIDQPAGWDGPPPTVSTQSLTITLPTEPTPTPAPPVVAPTPTPTPAPAPSAPAIPPAVNVGVGPPANDPATLAAVSSETVNLQTVDVPVTIDSSSGEPRVSPTSLDVPLPSFGDPFSAIALIVLTGLSGLFNGNSVDLSGLDNKINSLWANVLSLITPLLSDVLRTENVEGQSTNIFSKIASVIGNLINAVATLFSTIKGKLTDWFSPLLKLIQNVTNILKHLYQVWLAPILHTIDAIRQLLSILELFHVQWATALDQELAKIEAKITKPYLWALLELNQFTNWIDRIVTVDGLFQRTTLLASTWRHLGATYAQMHWAFWQNAPAARQQFAAAGDYPHVDPTTYASALSDYYSGQGGQLAGYVDEELVPTFRAAAGLDSFNDGSI